VVALTRKAGTQENLEMDRLAAASRWQRVQLNALESRRGDRSTFLSSWLPDSKSFQEDPNVKTLHLFSTEYCPLGKKEDAMQRIVMVFCILSGFVAASWADPSPTSNRITSRIPRQSVQSSAIAKVGYSKRRHILEIEFVNGAVYRYFDIPLSVHRDLMSAESKARFYDSKIRKHYRSVLVRQRQKQEPPEKSPASAPGYGAAARD
jgi:hypothetical protein